MLLSGSSLGSVELNAEEASGCNGYVAGLSVAKAAIAATLICSAAAQGKSSESSSIDSVRWLGVSVDGAARETGNGTANIKATGAVAGSVKNTGNINLGQNHRTVAIDGKVRSTASVTGEPITWQVKGACGYVASIQASLKSAAAVSGLVHHDGSAVANLKLGPAVSISNRHLASVQCTMSLGPATNGSSRYTGSIITQILASGLVQGTSRSTSATSAGLNASASVLGQTMAQGSLSGGLRFAATLSGSARMTGSSIPTVFRWDSVQGLSRATGSSTASLVYRGAVNGGYGYEAEVNGNIRHMLYGWKEGVAYRVVQDVAIGGLAQGGIKRTEIMHGLQEIM